MSEQHVKFLEDFRQYIGLTLMKKTLSAYYEAERILNGWDKIRKRDCSCELGALKNTVEAKYHQWTKSRKA